eukprot:COSAG04_NODE_2411_length_4181_cov_30.788084_4_plen_82_part_00
MYSSGVALQLLSSVTSTAMLRRLDSLSHWQRKIAPQGRNGAFWAAVAVAVPLLAGLVEFGAMEAEMVESDLLAIGDASGAP